MTNTLLIAIIVINFLLLAFFLFVGYKVFTVFRQFVGFITPEGEGKPSPLANFIQAGADIVSRTLVMQAKATFMGKQSGDSRAMKAIEGDVAQDMISGASPMLGGLLQSFPSLSKTLRRNPGLADMALQFLASKMGGNKGVSVPGNGTSESPRFNL